VLTRLFLAARLPFHRSAAYSSCLRLRAESPARRLRLLANIGLCVPSSARSVSTSDAFAFRGMRDLGYTIGQDIVIEIPFAEGRIVSVTDTRRRAASSQGRCCSMLLGPQAMRAASQSLPRIVPIRRGRPREPIRDGCRLGRRIWRGRGAIFTGFFLDLPELSGSRIQFLTEAVPATPACRCPFGCLGCQVSSSKATEGAAEP
jgi:hypothetical protein